MSERWLVIEDGFVHELDPTTDEPWTDDESARQVRYAQEDGADVYRVLVPD